LARFFATAQPGDSVPVQAMWSKHILWGNDMFAGGVVLPNANAWNQGVTWGATALESGDNIVWGSMCGDEGCDNIVWGSLDVDNIVWGSAVTGAVWSDPVSGARWTSGSGDAPVWVTDQQLLSLFLPAPQAILPTVTPIDPPPLDSLSLLPDTQLAPM